MTGRSALQIGLPVRRGLRRQGDRRGPDAAMVAGCYGGGHRNKEPVPLKEISRPVAKGAQAAVLMARAPGHTSGEVKGPETLTLIFLPARSPGLDRVGKVWQFLRENGLSNRLLEDQADGLAAGCDAWTRLMKEPTAIKSGASGTKPTSTNPRNLIKNWHMKLGLDTLMVIGGSQVSTLPSG